uniref:Uncharacterized protein n=1 Tax=Timema cristinae TaxID=61476 RepID=A0A7R9DIE3_TIMCR|nr:unnamed protein product [Timema cristinae]
MKAKSERRRPFIGDQVEDCRDASGLFYILPFQKTISDIIATVTGRIDGDKELLLFKKKRATIRASFTKIVKTTTDLFSVDGEKDLVAIETNHELL